MAKEKSDSDLEIKQYIGAFTRWFAIGGLVLHSAPHALKQYYSQQFNIPLPPTQDQFNYLSFLNTVVMMSYPIVYWVGAKIEGNAIIQRACNKSKELSDKIK